LPGAHDAFYKDQIIIAVWLGMFLRQTTGNLNRKRVEIGPVVETIITVAEGEGADLIAMASHGRTGLSRVFYGSIAAGVLQRVDRPLLLIRS